MSYGSQITKKWHEARHGKGPEPEKEDHSIRDKMRSRHEKRWGKPETADTGRQNKL